MKTFVKHLAWRSQAAILRIKGRPQGHCAACSNDVAAFLPFRSGSSGISPILQDLGLIGSNLDRFRCPHCGSTDRERHLLAYLESESTEFFRNKSILHFAPERAIRKLILDEQPGEYVMADLFPNDPAIVRMDITAIPFNAEHFDIVIANHVLEHVSDDRLALQEIHRVLKPGGFAILQTPYSPGLPVTLDIPRIRSREARLLLYGQEDHVRLFGSDIVARIESSELASRVRTHGEALSELDPVLNGVNPNEPFFLFAKAKPGRGVD